MRFSGQLVDGWVLERLYLATGRVEASFVSKLVATLNPALEEKIATNQGLMDRQTGAPLPNG